MTHAFQESTATILNFVNEFINRIEGNSPYVDTTLLCIASIANWEVSVFFQTPLLNSILEKFGPIPSVIVVLADVAANADFEETEYESQLPQLFNSF